jgi:carbonic anhydrase
MLLASLPVLLYSNPAANSQAPAADLFGFNPPRICLSSEWREAPVNCTKELDAVSGIRVARRAFLGLSTAAAAGALSFPFSAFADALTAEQREKLSPDEILNIMRQGNARFARGERKSRNYLREQQASAKGQHPAAMILSCIDSRAPAEVILDLGIGDVFNARVAGNIVNDDIAGSMEFACKLAGAKVILVMGHTACGAIKGAIDGAQLGNLTGLLAKIRPAVDATTYSGPRTSKDDRFVDAVARKNVELTMARLLETSPVLKELVASKKVKVAGAMYDLATAKVDIFS